MMNEQSFIEYCRNSGLSLTDKELQKFVQYYEILIKYNEITNLTSITAKEEVFLKHFYDSLTLLIYHQLSHGITLCDVGAGAGFPSIPLKIVRPDLKITIIDSLGKRIDFINYLVKMLDLKDVEAYHARAEDFAKQKRETFDVVTARAVARLNILSELCIPLVKVNGEFIAMKGQSGFEELQEANNAITTLGCKLATQYEFNLPEDAGKRLIFAFTKITKTPNKYPRNYGQIKNKPL